jgi:hypothetical protein
VNTVIVDSTVLWKAVDETIGASMNSGFALTVLKRARRSHHVSLHQMLQCGWGIFVDAWHGDVDPQAG